ncbi:MAG: CDP-alcohol phosphatidyltransferase family protein [Chloroflexi bacterium]|nr:CDP-alcohol phosphatidyltransferase family protein [Chloroflexota bacterium]
MVNIGAAALVLTEHLFTAGLVVLLAGLFDTLDGALARSTNRTTKFGAVLDSTLDRLSEAVVLLSILARYVGEQSAAAVVVVGLALVGSLMVSYIRAKAEALGLKDEIGLFTRTERVVVLALGLLLSQINYALITALVLIMVFSFITVSQRLLYVWQQTKN